MHMLPVAFLSRSAAPRVCGYKRFAQQNLAGGGLCLPRISKQGPMKTCFHGNGDIIEGFTMEEIPQ